MIHVSPAGRGGYPSDATQSQWEQIDLLLPLESHTGRGLWYSRREIVNAINYRWTTGCSWRMLPHDFPAWQTVYRAFRKWQALGLLAELRNVFLKRDRRLENDVGSEANEASAGKSSPDE